MVNKNDNLEDTLGCETYLEYKTRMVEQSFEIRCQNCQTTLGRFGKDDRALRYFPCDVSSLSFGIDADHTLITLQCPHCGCTVQVKS